jgi:hypothetical protein
MTPLPRSPPVYKTEIVDYDESHIDERSSDVEDNFEGEHD